MTAPVFHDGVYHAANRTNEASGRSWHIPARRGPSAIVMMVQLIVCAIPVAVLWALLS